MADVEAVRWSNAEVLLLEYVRGGRIEGLPRLPDPVECECGSRDLPRLWVSDSGEVRCRYGNGCSRCQFAQGDAGDCGRPLCGPCGRP